jgi:hypothetical protein
VPVWSKNSIYLNSTVIASRIDCKGVWSGLQQVKLTLNVALTVRLETPTLLVSQ